MPETRPTLEAVAAQAGVSRATVSRVVNGFAGVREEVREKVQRAVAELGYVPNSAARSLVTRRTGAIAVVIAEPERRVFADPFFAQQLRGVSRELSASDTQLVLLLVENSRDYDRIGRYLAGGHVDGTLMFSLHRDDPLPSMAAGSKLPTVFGGRPGWPGAEHDPELLYVDSDNRDGARQAVRHLLDRGRRRIGVITGPLDQTSAADRLEGYREVLAGAPGGRPVGGSGASGEAGESGTSGNSGVFGPAETGLAETGLAETGLVAQGDFTAEGGERAMTELLDRRPDLDAVFAGSDLMASGALRALRARGRRVPEDVAVVGYDDMESAAWSDPPLTTVHQDIEEMGGLMASLLLRRIGVVPPVAELAPVVTPVRLVVRSST